MRKNPLTPIVPLGKGSSKQTGKISDSALSRITEIKKDTLILWKKTKPENWRFKHYWFLKSFTEGELEQRIEESKALISSEI